MDTSSFETDLSLFKYDDLEALPDEYRELTPTARTERIEAARAELGDDVVVLGHNYQRREIVEHADFVGDSYQLSKEAANADADYVIFGGVTFMAESADIITDDSQSVILPSMEASCPMAGMAEALQVDAAWADITAAAPDETIIPITYMNSYADLKAFCAEQGGLVCTSSNAHRAFEWAFERGDKVLFLPDKHLGENTAHRLGMADATVEWDPWAAEGKTAEEVADADIVLWDGYCQVHERFTPEHVAEVRADHEDANVVVHPECRREVVEAADVVGSTATITETVADADPGETWAIGTEIHLANHLQRWHPEVNVVPLCGDACMDCNAMRQIDPNYLAWVLEELVEGRERNVIEVDSEEAELAQVGLDRMLEL
ncbi:MULTISPECIES: quinolinate synthase NadA [Halobacterium]|uniref:Quinolinate synthase n=6 Tax=Halobacterium salinarum TaxID=2242 RepID=NADA_HALSA|nr:MULTISPECIES: quinolinate synthase NadA [Halobacterium]B0R6K3.1 RecName: Full=Quinolinate synthase [Halobacterium salinarum R1]Q9HNZ1.1 RecName: Full=Quinolinate synthase [Halobacterium salinarum NRC-1]AAG20079.1 quinolinate synthetase [Halobacterium salinarum NRC-1]MBB6089089.1 quinolinate synthase [Halobacterium salinarum]MCF2207306.1 quinolinate synthase NadA [Halobacterium salinarum]MCF2240329.1 quinolinate synthase NadA [Halobacterium salinarum]MDL0119519.1 quinolinate synthase NadA 